MNNQAFESVTSEKLLGVVVDQNLTWKGNVDKVHRAVRCSYQNSDVNIKPFLPTDACIKYSQAMIIVVQSGDLPNYNDCTS